MSNQFTAQWKPEEDKILRDNIGLKTYKDLSRLLLGRSRQAVKNRAKILGIQGNKKLWTQEELQILRDNYRDNPRVAELLPRFKWE